MDWAHELLVYFGFTLCAMAVDVEAAGSDMVLPGDASTSRARRFDPFACAVGRRALRGGDMRAAWVPVPPLLI